MADPVRRRRGYLRSTWTARRRWGGGGGGESHVAHTGHSSRLVNEHGESYAARALSKEPVGSSVPDEVGTVAGSASRGILLVILLGRPTQTAEPIVPAFGSSSGPHSGSGRHASQSRSNGGSRSRTCSTARSPAHRMSWADRSPTMPARHRLCELVLVLPLVAGSRRSGCGRPGTNPCSRSPPGNDAAATGCSRSGA